MVKSDTDGYDVELIPSIARAWSDSAPVMFFEYDPKLSRIAGNDPLAVWSELSALGYSAVAAWNNYGRPVGHFAIADVGTAAAVLDEPVDGRAQVYWDVAVVHGKDAAGLTAIESLTR